MRPHALHVHHLLKAMPFLKRGYLSGPLMRVRPLGSVQAGDLSYSRHALQKAPQSCGAHQRGWGQMMVVGHRLPGVLGLVRQQLRS